MEQTREARKLALDRGSRLDVKVQQAGSRAQEPICITDTPIPRRRECLFAFL